MNIVVFIKRVPNVSDGELKVDASGKGVDSSNFSFEINDADNYAMEEAVLLKEAWGGTVQVVCSGPAEADIMIRMALAKGGDQAVRIDDSRINTIDPLQVARILAASLKGQQFDLVLTGCTATDDDGYMAVGVALAEELGVPHAAIVKKIELEDGKIKAYRELEDGISEVVEISMPAVLTIQTGINELRYAPFKSIREAQKKEIKILKLEDLGLSENDVSEASSLIELKRLYIPEVESKAKIIEGQADEKAATLAEIMVEGGLF